ncbi:MAG: hypothetical protein IJZ57_07885 [Clostridia bacterium]|nr:hypothetical protein [Clostridia bacterium]
MTHKKWAISTISFSLVLLLILSSITFIVDPLYQYRYDKNDKYYLNPQFSCAGLIKNYNYDSIMLGSSMTQNFDPDLFKEKMGLDLLKVNIGGMTVPETCFYLKYINEHSSCKKVFVSVDLQRFAIHPDNAEFNIPEHLINGYSDDYRYLLSSEVYTRFLPVDLIIKGMEALDITVPSFIKSSTDIDEIGAWHSDFSIGENAVLKSLEKRGYGVSKIEADGVETPVNANVDLLFSTISELNNNTEYVLFFPPYSSLYWIYAKDNGHFDAFCDAKEKIVTLAQQYQNVSVYDFQSFELTTDLDNYRDISHYSKEINDYLVECFADGTGFISDISQIKANKAGISEKADATYLKYKTHIDTYCKIEKE